MRPNQPTNTAFAIKAEVSEPSGKAFAFSAHRTMYGGKHIAKGDVIFVFASENEGGAGLVARDSNMNAIWPNNLQWMNVVRSLAA